MPQIFLSYCREDLVVARRFAEGFEREGFTVWWDQSLTPGEAFDKVTEQALEEAGAVVVLWSKHAVESRWVRAEATQASAMGTLVPVMIEAQQKNIDRTPTSKVMPSAHDRSVTMFSQLVARLAKEEK